MNENKSVAVENKNFDISSGRTGVSISVKILAVTLGTTILVMLVSGIISFMISKNAIEEQLFDQLTSVRELKGQQIENYVERLGQQIITQSSNPAIVAAMQTFRNAFQRELIQADRADTGGTDARGELASYYRDDFFARLRTNAQGKLRDDAVSSFLPKHPGSVVLQKKYISDNPYPTGEKDTLFSAGKSLYDSLHEKYHPYFQQYLERFGFYDIFLVDHKTGYIVYSVFKEVDFATSLYNGPYKDTNFARAVRSAGESGGRNFVKLEDFEPYPPSYNAPASFIASPIFDGARKVGILVFQMPIDRLNNIMTSNQEWANVGLGRSGESYIVGDDFTMRNQSRFLIEDSENFFTTIRNTGLPEQTVSLIESFNSTIGLLPVETEGTQAALGGQTGAGTFPDYRGVNVLSSYRPLKIRDVNWAIMSEIDESEAFTPIERLKDRTILGASVLIAIAIYLAFYFSRSMTANLSVLTVRAKELSEGELDEPILVGSRDEIGQLAHGFEGMRQSIRKLVDDLQTEKEALEDRVTERTAKLDEALHMQEKQTAALLERNTEMEKIQEELRNSELEQKASKDRIDSILQASPDGICVINTEGEIKMVNASMLDIFGYELDEVMGNNIKMLMHDDIASKHDHYLERIVWGREPKLIGKGVRELEGRNKDGTLFPIDLSVSMVGEGKNALFVGIIRDVTERKKTEKQILAQSAFQAALLDAVPSPVFVKDVDGIYTAFNRAYEEAYGMRREDFIGKTTLDLSFLDKDTREEYHSGDAKLIEEGGFQRVELPVKFADGEEHDVISWLRTFDLGDGTPGGMLGILIDISDRKEMERATELAKEQAEEANKTKSEFLANMSHELRTPMNAIIGYGEMLKEDAEDDGNEDIIPDLDKIITAGQHLLQLINDVLDISKIEAGRMDLYLEEFDITEMINNAVSTVTTLVEKNDNVLSIEIEENIGSVYADLTKVRQMIFNLVSNAAKFTHGGTIGIQAIKTENMGEPFISLRVSDTGIGISAEKLDHIFEEFSQADSSTTRNYGGTGLGLALVRKFARMMGGDIAVESEEGTGSTFILNIPQRVVDADSKEDQPTEEPPITGMSGKPGSGKILVIDDDPTARNLLKRHLEAEGYRVLTAEDGKHGVKLAKSEQPAAITCDIQMPNIDGWKVLKLLKADSDTKDIPVIMVSMVDDGARGIALGAMEHLRKPVDRQQLKQVISRYVNEADTVLIVEDDSATQELLSKSLKAEKINTCLANNGQEALKKLEQRRPDLILLDLMMPVMDGFQFLDHFKKLEDSEKIPVIVVTAKELTKEEREELAKSVLNVVTKEEDYVTDLIRDINQAVHGKKGAKA